MLQRRRFLHTAGAMLAAPVLHANAQPHVPAHRPGVAGLSITRLGLGTADLERLPRSEAYALLDAAYRLGVRLFDAAPEYGAGLSEQLLGECMADRSEALIASKTLQRGWDGAWRDLEASLGRLRRNRLDIWMLHDVRTEYEWGLLRERHGAMSALLDAKSQGVVRAIGFSANRNPALAERLLCSGLFDLAMLPLNAGFEAGAFAAAREAGVGVLGMKVFCAPGKKVMNDASPRDRLRRALRLPIVSAVIGCADERRLRENVETARGI